MAHHKHEPKPIDPKSLEEGYEVGEMQFKVILIFGVIISAATIISMVLMVFFYGALKNYAPSTSQYTPSPLARDAETAPVPLAPVEAEPVIDRLALEDPAIASLHEYGWVSRDAGIARIPIEEAMAKIVAHGELPRLVPIEAVIGPQAPAGAGDNTATQADAQSSDVLSQTGAESPAVTEAGAAPVDTPPASAPPAGQE